MNNSKWNNTVVLRLCLHPSAVETEVPT
ncbi:hypothetical protein VTN49DRAFT_6563 [Thermomyces lanuginosus]